MISSRLAKQEQSAKGNDERRVNNATGNAQEKHLTIKSIKVDDLEMGILLDQQENNMGRTAKKVDRLIKCSNKNMKTVHFALLT